MKILRTYWITPLGLMAMLFLNVIPILASENEDQSKVPAEARVIGIIDLNTQSENVIETPKTVKAGKDFEVKILTAGGGCEREGDTSVILEEASASVFVYDFTTATHPGVACTMIFKRLPHTATLNFKKPGEVVIRVWGRRIGSDTPPGGEPMILEKKITIE